MTPNSRKRLSCLSRILFTLMLIFACFVGSEGASFATNITAPSSDPESCAATDTANFNGVNCWVQYGDSAGATQYEVRYYTPTGGSSDDRLDAVQCLNGAHASRTFSIGVDGTHRLSDLTFSLSVINGGSFTFTSGSTCDAIVGGSLDWSGPDAGQEHTPITWGTLSAPPPSPWCASSDFGSPAGSWVLDSSGTSGTLSVRFQWTIAVPSAGWTVLYPDSGGGFSQNLGPYSTVDGSPNTYFKEWSGVTTHTPLTAKIVAPTVSGNPGCSVIINLATNQIAASPTDTTTGASGDTSTSSNPNCGWSLNPFHYLKCLFEPSTSLQQWNDLQTTARTHPPISLIIGGISYINTGISAFSSGYECGSGGTLPACADTFQGPGIGDTTNGNANLIQAACDYMTGCTSDHSEGTPWGQVVYYLLEAAIGGFFLFRIWALIAASFGTKDNGA